MCVLFIFEVKSLEVADEKKKERKVMSPGRFLASLLSDDEKSIKDPDDDKHNRGGNAPDPWQKVMIFLAMMLMTVRRTDHLHFRVFRG